MRKILFLALAFLAEPFLLSAQEAVVRQCETVFKKGDYGYHTFRIPAVVRTGSGAILCFAEARRNSAKDSGDIDLVMKRSVDGGRTWSDMIVVWDDAENVCGNPSPVVLPQSGRILLLSTWNNGQDSEKQIGSRTSRDTRRVFMLYSDDDGLSWSEAKEITSSVKRPEWTWYATGPCHAIVKNKRPHKGRIIVPCDHGEFESRTSHSHVIYSDDGGDSWHLGGDLGSGNESTVAELRSGALILNMRGSRMPDHRNQYRSVSISRDGGRRFSIPYKDTTLIEPVCQACLLNYSSNGQPGDILLFSNPASMPERRNMTIRRSSNGGRTWNDSIRLSDRYAAYSDMVMLDGGDVGIFYETGDAGPYETMVFSIISHKIFER